MSARANRRDRTLLVAACLSLSCGAAFAQGSASGRSLKELGDLDYQVEVQKRKNDLETAKNKDKPASSAAPMPVAAAPAPSALPLGLPTAPSNPYAYAPTAQQPAAPVTPAAQGVRLRATYGVGSDVTAIFYRANGDIARVKRGDVFDGWRVDDVQAAIAYLSRYRAPASSSRSAKGSAHHTAVATRAVSSGPRYRVEIDPPQGLGGGVDLTGMTSGAGGGNRIIAQPLGNLPNPMRNVNQVIPAGSIASSRPQLGASAPPAMGTGGLVGGGPTTATPQTNTQLSNITQQVAPGLQPAEQRPTYNPADSLR